MRDQRGSRAASEEDWKGSEGLIEESKGGVRDQRVRGKSQKRDVRYQRAQGKSLEKVVGDQWGREKSRNLFFK